MKLNVVTYCKLTCLCTFQELIQNADDAEATEVKFLYDSCSYGKQSLLTPELGKFQGPALYAYNNAEFQKKDWEGIQSLMQSTKKDDPLKVGRFGIGFNSVYHITGQRALCVKMFLSLRGIKL